MHPAIPEPWASWRHDEGVRISDVRAICTAPDGVRLVLVKISTTTDGLYGLGCATFAQRPSAVVAAVEDYLAPLLVGRDPDNIQDIWNAAHLSSYWRGGPVLNNALSGVDQALWDILGKRAGLPVHQLIGGKVRDHVRTYAHANGSDLSELSNNVASLLDLGYQHVRCQLAVPGYATYGSGAPVHSGPQRPEPAYRLALNQARWASEPYLRLVPKMFEHLRTEFGGEIEILHDVHERIPPTLAPSFARTLEDFRPFFLEDLFAPEDIGHYARVRELSTTPLATGELFTSSEPVIRLVTNHLIDYLRIHLSDIGGFTPALKLTALCELFGVRTAWHGPSDLSPIGQAANVHLGIATPAFGIQEYTPFSDRTRECFPDALETTAGALRPNGAPGWGVDIDEQAAARYPFPDHPLNGAWPEIRNTDGSIIRP